LSEFAEIPPGGFSPGHLRRLEAKAAAKPAAELNLREKNEN
jgi:hypothetical protein